MPKMILPPDAFRRLVRDRRRMGRDRLDEVWDGVYVMSPEADNEHQKLSLELASTFLLATREIRGAEVYPTINISDREENWRKNFRIPDVSVFLPGHVAQDRGTHWLGGPDFAVEIVSPGDRSRKKFGFFSKVGVRELLIVDRAPWRLELHRRGLKNWKLAGTSSPDSPDLITSDVLPLTFRMLPAEPRPLIEVARADGGQTWTI